MTQLFCHRHLLHSLQTNPYSYHAKLLIKSATDFEFNNACEFLANIFHTDIENDGKKHSHELMIEQILNKIGLCYSYQNNKIDVKDKKRWDQRSMLKRVSYSMPSTTNSLESTHGHLNKKTPSRNNFRSALYRVISNLTKQNNLYKEKVIHNYNQVIRKTKNRAKNLSKERMNN